MAEKLTPQQETAVNDRGGVLLVSAAAGSGKTKVLVDRLLRYITDQKEPANVDDFLIITYTKAAAAELRAKIAQKFSERIASEPNNQHLHRQMQRLYLAKISTVHAFCTEILRENAYRMDIPSDFRVCEERDSIQMQLDAIDIVLEGAYNNIHEDAQIRDFLDTQGLGRDDRQVPPILLSVYRSARCHMDPEGWLQWCEDQADADGVADAAHTIWGAYLIEKLHSFLDLNITALDNCILDAQKNGQMPTVVQLLSDTVQQLKQLRSFDTWDDISNFPSIDYGRLTFPRKCTDTQLCEQIKVIREHLKKDLAMQMRSFSDSSQQVLADLRKSGSSTRGLIKLVRQFSEEYERHKKRQHSLDFADLEHKTLDLLLGKSRSGVTAAAREIGSRFREIMVDEYQDSNGVQDAIFHALTEKNQNCFMVGDVKQSIYQFRLADPTIFIDKYNRFVPAADAVPGQGRKVVLSSNFRSSAGVISAVNDVFTQSMSKEVGGLPYTADEMLYEGIPHVPLNEPEVELYAVDVASSSVEEEAAFVAERISQLLDGSHKVRNGDQLRPIQASDIVILLRSPTTSGGYFLNALACKGISCTMGGSVDLLQTEEVSVLISLLQVLLNPQQDIPLIAVMASRIFGFTADDLAKIRAQDHKNSVYDALKADTSPKASSFVATIEQLRGDAQISSLADLLYKIFAKTNFYRYYFAMIDGQERCANLQTFCQVAADFAGGGQRDLGQFLDYLRTLEDSGLMIETQQANSESVTIMTIHSSKGLEFPVVFLCGLARSFNRESIYQPVLCHKEMGLGLNFIDTKQRVRYPTVAKKAIAERITEESISEEMRVLYVAMTRARDRLIMTYASRNLQKKLSQIGSRLTKSPRILLTGSANCPGEWIIQTALGRTEAGELLALSGDVGSCVSEFPWLIRVVQAQALVQPDAGSYEDPSALSADAAARIAKGLSFRYEHSLSTNVPSKQTATQLKRRGKDQEVAEHTAAKKNVAFRKPSFIQKVYSPSARGEAVHAFMQYARFGACKDLMGIQQEVSRMVDNLLLTQEQADMIDIHQILAFFSSDIGMLLQQNKFEVLREFKFSILVDADRYYPDVKNEKILLQGVVDCALIKPDGIIVIDFKTDWITDEQIELIKNRYRLQVEAYTQALAKIYDLPVSEAYLYVFKLNKFVKM